MSEETVGVRISADVTNARAQLAVMQAELRATTRDMNALANTARASGSALDLRNVGAAADRVAELKSAMSGLRGTLGETRSLSSALNNAFGRMSGIIREPLDALAMMSSKLRQTAEVTGALYAVDKIKDFAVASAKAGEETMNNAYALGMGVRAYAQFSGALQLTGSSAERAQHTIEHLARAVEQAMVEPNAKTGPALGFRQLGITMEELRTKGNDLPSLFELILQRINAMPPGLQRTAAASLLLGRGMDSVAGALRANADGFREDMTAANGYADSVAKAAPFLDKASHQIHQLGLDWSQLGNTVAPVTAEIVNDIDEMVNTLRSLVAMIERARQAWGDFGIAVTSFWPAKLFNLLRHPGGMLSGSAGTEGTNPFSGPTGTASVTLPEVVVTAKRSAPWASLPAAAGRGHRARGAAPIEAGFTTAEQSAEGTQRVDTSYLSSFRANMRALADQKKITVAQMYGFDIQYTAQLAGQEQQRLDAAMAAANAIVATTQAEATKRKAAQLRVYEQELELSAHTAAMIAEDQQGIARNAGMAGEKAAEAFAKPFKSAFSSIGGDFEKTITDMLLHKGTKTNMWKGLYQSMVGQGVNAAGSFLSQTAAPVVSGALGMGPTKPGETTSEVLAQGASQLAQLILHSSLLGGILSTTSATAAAATAGAATGAAGSILGGAISGGATLATGGGGILSGIGSFFTGIGAFLGFSSGGIVPSAAGGWSLPSFPGAQPALLHSREMVLPAHISEGLQDMIGQGGGGDTHLHLHSNVMDGPSVDRWFKGMVARNPHAISDLLRSNRLTPRTI